MLAIGSTVRGHIWVADVDMDGTSIGVVDGPYYDLDFHDGIEKAKEVINGLEGDSEGHHDGD